MGPALFSAMSFSASALLTPRQLLAVADAFALAAARIVDVRLARRAEMTDPEVRTLAQCEDRLSKAIAWLRVSELAFAGATGEQVAQLVSSTVNCALPLLSPQKSVTQVVACAQSLAAFADVTLTRDAGQLAQAARKMRERRRGSKRLSVS